jgi:hypothetical protein
VSSVLNAIPAVANAVTTSYINDGAVTAAKMAASGAWAPAGTVVQVVSVIKTDTASTGSTSWSDISGLSASITPTSSSSKILIFLNVTGGNNNGGGAVKLLRNTTDIAIATTGTGSQTNAAFGNYFDNGDNNSMRGHGLSFLDSPSTTSAVTYKTQFRLGISGSGWLFYVNRAFGNDDAGYSIKTVSSITLMEIAG